MSTHNRPLVAIADVHGHSELFDRLVSRLDRDYGRDYDLVTLGDYVDNGPDVRGLLDRLVSLSHERPDRFFPIMGNHDLACLRAVGWEDGAPDPYWFARWSDRYWSDEGTPQRSYGAASLSEFVSAFPRAHRVWLQALPWFVERAGHVFVHAGLEAGPVAPQLKMLERRELLGEGHTQPQLREKKLATMSDPSWGCVVVSGHTKTPGSAKSFGRHFATPCRVTLNSNVDHGKSLWAVELHSRRAIGVAPNGSFEEGALT
jgi:hypothetical protein